MFIKYIVQEIYFIGYKEIIYYVNLYPREPIPKTRHFKLLGLSFI